VSGRKLDLLALGAAGGGYLLNRLWLCRVTEGWLRAFLICWANDILAGLFMIGWLNLLLGLGRLGRVRRPAHAALFLLGCALVWELAAPAFKPNAVFDLWDFAAYQAGGAIYLAAERLREGKGKGT